MSEDEELDLEELDEDTELDEETDIGDPLAAVEENPDNARNNVSGQEIGGNDRVPNIVGRNAGPAEPIQGIQEDVAALIEGEELTEEFKQKAATIFEAAVISRVRQESARLEEAYEAQLTEEIEAIKEGLVEKTNGYLDYVVEQWMEHNEIALDRGIVSEHLGSFIEGLKSLFEEHYIDIPEEKYDVLSAIEESLEEVSLKLDEQVAMNIELNSIISGYEAQAIVEEACSGLVETDKAKLRSLAEELEFEGIETFAKKVQTIRESYFVNKTPAKAVVESVVTDTPVMLTEEGSSRPVDPSIKNYMSVLDNLKK